MPIISDETISIIQGSPAVNDAIIAVALLFNAAAFIVSGKSAKRLLATGCITSLLMPIYDFASAYIGTMRSGWHVFDMFFVAYMMLVFSPTNIVFIFVLIFVNTVRRVKLWSIVVSLGSILSWFGIASFIYILS